MKGHKKKIKKLRNKQTNQRKANRIVILTNIQHKIFFAEGIEEKMKIALEYKKIDRILDLYTKEAYIEYILNGIYQTVIELIRTTLPEGYPAMAYYMFREPYLVS
jgi:hypothetical protein